MGNKRSVNIYIYIYIFDRVGQMGSKTINLNHDPTQGIMTNVKTK